MTLTAKLSSLAAVFAAGLALALGGCGDEDQPAATTGQRGENTATLSPRDTTTEATVTETGLTGTTDETETETTETDGEDDDGSGGYGGGG